MGRYALLLLFHLVLLHLYKCIATDTAAVASLPTKKPKKNKIKSHPPAILPGAVVIMTSLDWKMIRNNRKCGFNMTMDRLAKFWRPHNPYPIILMKDNQWTASDLSSIRDTWPSLDIMFLDISQSFQVSPPSDLVLEDHAAPLSNIAYKRMITFFFHGFTRVPELVIYKYLMRFDDDSCLDNPINFDIFEEMNRRRSVYAYQAMMTDLPHVTVGLYDFIDAYAEKFNVTFANRNLREIRKSHDNRRFMFSTNLEVIDTIRYRQPNLMHFVDYVVSSHMIFHRRWGDANLRYALAELFYGPNEVLRLCEFTYFHSSWTPHRSCERRSHFNAVVGSARDEIAHPYGSG
jgi:hypothetical protein